MEYHDDDDELENEQSKWNLYLEQRKKNRNSFAYFSLFEN